MMIRIAIVALTIGLLAGTAAANIPGGLVVAPLPIEEVAAARGLTPVPVDLSPDGEWLAYTAEDAKAQPPKREGGQGFTATGVPMTWGGGQAELWVTNTVTGENIDLNAPGAMSWGGIWSPDGKRLAFYSDRSGEVNVWIWERATRQTRRLSGTIARPYFWFELPRWSPDGQMILCKVLPERMTLRQAAALLPTTGPRVAIEDWAKPSVFVLTSPGGRAVGEGNTAGQAEIVGGASTNAALADLALIDVETGAVTRIVRNAKPRWFSVSPDGRVVGFTDLLGWEANSQQPVYDLAAVITAVVASDLLEGYLYMNNDGTDGTGYYEEGQGGMGGTPWQYPARYHDNSPVYFFDKVETPLLMAHGAMDSLPMWWPDATFVALRRLGKKVQYVTYGGEGHVISGYANTVDFWNRRLAFLRENLEAAKADVRP